MSQEEFDDDLNQRRECRKHRKAWQGLVFGVMLVFAILAFVLAGKFMQVIDPSGNGKVGAGMARIAILFSMMIVSLILWVVRQMDED